MIEGSGSRSVRIMTDPGGSNQYVSGSGSTILGTRMRFISIVETCYFEIFCTSVVPADCRAEWRQHPADWWKQRRPVRRGAPPPCWFATWISQTRKPPLKTGHKWKQKVHSICKNLKNINVLVRYSVTDSECLSRVLDLDFYPSRITDSTIATKEEGKNLLSYLFL